MTKSQNPFTVPYPSTPTHQAAISALASLYAQAWDALDEFPERVEFVEAKKGLEVSFYWATVGLLRPVERGEGGR